MGNALLRSTRTGKTLASLRTGRTLALPVKVAAPVPEENKMFVNFPSVYQKDKEEKCEEKEER